MPSNLVEVDIVADATQAKAAIADLTRSVDTATARMESDFGQVNAASSRITNANLAPGSPGSGILTPVPRALGGTGDLAEAEQLKAAVKDLREEFAKTDAEIKETGTSMEEAGRKGSGAFEKIEGMISRMMIRLIAFKLVFDAIKMIGDAINTSVNWQAFEAHYKSFTGDAAGATQRLQEFEQVASRTGADAGKMGEMALQLEKVGENANQAAQDAKLLNLYAEASGEDANKLLSAFERVRLGTGTLEDMRELVALEGEAGRATLDQINALEEYEVQLKRVEMVENRLYTLEQRRVGEQERQNDAVEGFSAKFGLADAVLNRMVNNLGTTGAHLHLIRGGTEVANINMEKAGNAMARMLAIGNQRIMQEEGINSQTLKQLEQYGVIDAGFVLQAYHRKIADDDRKREWAHEDQQYNRRMALIQAEWRLNAQVTKEIQAGVGLQKLWAEHSQTAAAAIKEMQQAFAQIARDMPGLATAMANLAHEAERVANALDKFFKAPKSAEWDWPIKQFGPQAAQGAQAVTGAVQGAAQFLHVNDQSVFGILLRIYEHQLQVFGTGK